MSHMAYSLKAIRKCDIPLISLFFMSEPRKDILILIIFIVQLDLSFLNTGFVSPLFREVIHCKRITQEDELIILVGR
jgi:hypothetical protein